MASTTGESTLSPTPYEIHRRDNRHGETPVHTEEAGMMLAVHLARPRLPFGCTTTNQMEHSTGYYVGVCSALWLHSRDHHACAPECHRKSPSPWLGPLQNPITS